MEYPGREHRDHPALGPAQTLQQPLLVQIFLELWQPRGCSHSLNPPWDPVLVVSQPGVTLLSPGELRLAQSTRTNSPEPHLGKT